MNAELEALIDRRVQARLSTDRDYLFAENAEEQVLAERKIELQERLAVYLTRISTRPSDDVRHIRALEEELERTFQALRELGQ